MNKQIKKFQCDAKSATMSEDDYSTEERAGCDIQGTEIRTVLAIANGEIDARVLAASHVVVFGLNDKGKRIEIRTVLAIANGEIDARALAASHVAAFGLNDKGKWIGHEKASKFWVEQLNKS